MKAHPRVQENLIGRFVSDRNFGPAKIVGIEGGKYKVEYFISPWKRKIVSTASASLEHPQLYKQSRVYIENNGRWRIGRVVYAEQRSDGAFDYEVRFPNDIVESFSEELIFTRCWMAHDDPTSSLALGGTETQFWYEQRHRFAEMLLKQRSACRGLSALLSSRIELVPHQLEVARRVLEDPLQRYLLADEVGMGKTIEAGIIVRQFLISNPKGGDIWVLVPSTLLVQWKAELSQKFGIHEFGDRVHFFRSDALDELPVSVPAMLIVDEAHHLVSANLSPKLRMLAVNVPRLLLLSATPALGRPETLLNLLKLLDPDCYGSVELDAFCVQVDKREEIGIFLRGLRSDANPVVLKQRLRRLSELFPLDIEAERLGEIIGKSLADADPDGIRRSVTVLRTHLADIHRIHQRLIRTRRRDAVDWAFRPRGPRAEEGHPTDLSHVRMTWVDDSRYVAVFDLFEQWRMEADESFSQVSLDRTELSRWTLLMFEALGTGIDRFGSLLRKVPDRFLVKEWQTLFCDAIAVPNDDDPRPVQIAQDIRRHLDLLRQSKHDKPGLVAVFGTDVEDLRDVARALEQLIGASKIFIAWEDAKGTSDVAVAFESNIAAQVIFCGKSEEEGLNLHFVDAIIHLDLPFSPSRIEQRIGRLDRFGRKLDKFEQRVVFPAIDEQASLWEAWFEVLGQGFKIFNASVTDVQFVLDDMTVNLSDTLLGQGASGLRAQIGAINERLTAERNKLDNQYALDVVLQEEGAENSLFESLDALEDGEDQIASSITGWMLEALHFACKGDYSKVFRFQWDPERTLLPVYPWAQLFKPALDGTHTFRRSCALRDSSQPQLLRIGSPLVQRLENEFSWDDRGTAYATWRTVPSFEYGEWLGFKLTYIVEARLPCDMDEEGRASATARLDGYMAPWLDVIFVDAELRVVEDDEFLNLMDLSYEKGRDTNISSRPELLDAIMDRSFFEKLCRDVRNKSESFLRNSEKFGERLSYAAEAGKIDIDRRVLRLKQRGLIRNSLGEPKDSGLDAEIRLNELLLDVLKDPIVRLDSIGLTVLSGRSPAEFLSDGS